MHDTFALHTYYRGGGQFYLCLKLFRYRNRGTDVEFEILSRVESDYRSYYRANTSGCYCVLLHPGSTVMNLHYMYPPPLSNNDVDLGWYIRTSIPAQHWHQCLDKGLAVPIDCSQCPYRLTRLMNGLCPRISSEEIDDILPIIRSKTK